MNPFVENYRRYSEDATIWDMLKFVAIISMIFGHIGSYFIPDEQWFRMIGRVCVPIWFMLAGYGYRPHQRNTIELLVLASALVVVDYIFNDPLLPLNILFTHLFGRFFLSYIASYDRDKTTVCILTIVLLLLWLPSNVMFEYGTEVFFFMLVGFYAHHGNTPLATITLVIATLIYLPSQIFAFRFTSFEALCVVIMVVPTIVTLYWMGIKHSYFKQPLPTMGLVNNVIKMVARNTLAIYVLHVACFVIAAWVINTDRLPLATVTQIIK